MVSIFDSEPPCHGAEGEARRDAALNLLRQHRAALVRECTAATLRLALANGEVCADDVRPLLTIPKEVSPKFVGCVFRDLADAGILRRIGYRTSKRAIAHARPLSLWTLADADAATARLASLQAN